MIHQNSLKLKVGENEVSYYECTSKYPLTIEARGEKTLRILSRLQFSDAMGQEESYRIKVKEKDKIIGTYYFNSERSPNSHIIERLDMVPGKWRTCEIRVPKGSHQYTIEVPIGIKLYLRVLCFTDETNFIYIHIFFGIIIAEWINSMELYFEFRKRL